MVEPNSDASRTAAAAAPAAAAAAGEARRRRKPLMSHLRRAIRASDVRPDPPGSPANIPITSGFGWRATPPGTIDFYGQGGYMHTGIDFGAPCGTPVYAAAAGTVFSAGWGDDGGGNRVKLSHGVIHGDSLTTIYYHNSSIVVSSGQQVAQGQLIAYSGSTGNSTGCHAALRDVGQRVAVDPMTLL